MVYLIFALIGLIMVFIKVPILGFALVIVICIALFFIYMGSPKSEDEERNLKMYQKEQENKKYNFYRYTCPMCGSKKIVNISKASKAISAEIFGLASDKVGKCYQCDDCKYMW